TAPSGTVPAIDAPGSPIAQPTGFGFGPGSSNGPPGGFSGGFPGGPPPGAPPYAWGGRHPFFPGPPPFGHGGPPASQMNPQNGPVLSSRQSQNNACHNGQGASGGP